jgi:hypothetical protein
MPELRVEIPLFTAAVLDGFCSATGVCRTELVNEILSDWAHREHHKATIILRVADDAKNLSERRK